MESKCNRHKDRTIQNKLLWLGRFLREMTLPKRSIVSGRRDGKDSELIVVEPFYLLH